MSRKKAAEKTESVVKTPLVECSLEERGTTTILLAKSETLKRFLQTNLLCAKLILKSAIESINSSIKKKRDCYYPPYPGNYKQFMTLQYDVTINMFTDLLKTNEEIDLPKLAGFELVDFVYFTLFHGRTKLEFIKEVNKKYSIWKFDDIGDISISQPVFTPLFHGSSLLNLYSIFCNDLRSMSNTALMSSGAAHGNGIYCTNMNGISIALSYAHNKTDVSDNGILLVMESFMKKTVEKINVIQNDEFVIRYAIVSNDDTRLSNHSASILSEIKKIICDDISKRSSTISVIETNFSFKAYENTTNENIMKSTNFLEEINSTVSRRLQMETKKFANEKTRPKEVLSFELVNDRIDHWKLLLKIDDDSDLGKDLIKYHFSGVLLHILFKSADYPFSPPFVFVENPIFQQLTGHVVDGAVCSSILSTSSVKSNDAQWSPMYTMESLIQILKGLLSIDGSGRLDSSKLGQSYSMEQAKKGFQRAMNTHQW